MGYHTIEQVANVLLEGHSSNSLTWFELVSGCCGHARSPAWLPSVPMMVGHTIIRRKKDAWLNALPFLKGGGVPGAPDPPTGRVLVTPVYLHVCTVRFGSHLVLFGGARWR